MSAIRAILMSRDGMAAKEADELIQELKDRVANGEDAEELLYEELGLEPDYIFDLLDVTQFKL